jgi:hypothetical protein
LHGGSSDSLSISRRNYLSLADVLPVFDDLECTGAPEAVSFRKAASFVVIARPI